MDQDRLIFVSFQTFLDFFIVFRPKIRSLSFAPWMNECMTEWKRILSEETKKQKLFRQLSNYDAIFQPSQSCNKPEILKFTQPQPLTLAQLHAVFVLTLLLFFVALSLLIGEKMIWIWIRKSKVLQRTAEGLRNGLRMDSVRKREMTADDFVTRILIGFDQLTSETQNEVKLKLMEWLVQQEQQL